MLHFFRRASPPPALTYEQMWRDDFPLLYFGRGKQDPYCVGDSYKHCFVTGASGSGKTSGSLATLFRAYLRTGYGGLVLCAKPDERALWERYCRQTGRLDDLVVVAPEAGIPWRFNFLDYELRRKGRGAGSVTNIVELFSTIMDIIENNTKEKISEDFWDRTALDLVRYAVIVLSVCEVTLSVENIKRFIASAPQKGEGQDPDWQALSYAGQRLQEAYRNARTPRQQADLKASYDYFMNDLAMLNDRTRSSIEITFSSIASKFLVGDVREMLCTSTTLVPDALWHGKIVVLDMPIDYFNKEGLLIQGIIKYCFQKALLRRSLDEHPRPVFIACDEYHNFLSSFDYRFLSEARSHGVSMVMATQNISNVYSILGAGARDQANSLLGNAALKVIHANTDNVTNLWASEVIGQEWMKMRSVGLKQNEPGGTGITVSDQIHNRRLPSDFMTLKSGGAPDWEVEAYIVQTGRGLFSSTKNVFHKAVFRQEFGE
jgi:hypothetical protein